MQSFASKRAKCLLRKLKATHTIYKARSAKRKFWFGKRLRRWNLGKREREKRKAKAQTQQDEDEEKEKDGKYQMENLYVFA